MHVGIQAYKNLFYIYRPPRERGETSTQQIENNFTRAIAILIDPGNIFMDEKLCGDWKYSAEIIDKILLLDPPESLKEIKKDLGKVRYVSLQTFASGNGSEDSNKNCILDAILHFENGNIGIESKIKSEAIGEVDEQLKNEKENLEGMFSNPQLVLLAPKNVIAKLDKEPAIHHVSWEKIHSNVEKYLGGGGIPKDKKFILEQFNQYLEMNGMADKWVGLDFDLIGQNEYSGKIKQKLTDFLQQMRNKTPELTGFEIESKRRSKEAQKERKNRSVEEVLWDSLYDPKIRKADLKEIPHYTLGADKSGLQFSLTVEGTEAPKLLIRGMLQSNGRNELLGSISDLEVDVVTPKKDPYFFFCSWSHIDYGRNFTETILETKVPIYRKTTMETKKPHRYVEKHHPATTLLRKEAIDNLLNDLERQATHNKKDNSSPENKRYSYLRITLNIPKDLLEEMTWDNQVGTVCELSKPLWQIYPKWVRWWQTGKTLR